MAKITNELLDHTYDGIQEYDNPLPGWWLWLFIITVIWGFAYLYYYHISGFAYGQEDEYLAEVAAAEKMKPDTDNFEYILLSGGAEIDDGKVIYDKNCASCHGKLGEGGIGPNLTDGYWIHGGSFDNIVTTIIDGVPAKNMIPWKGILKPQQIQSITSLS